MEVADDIQILKQQLHRQVFFRTETTILHPVPVQKKSLKL